MPFSGPSINQTIRMKLKNSADTSVLVGVYVVFQLAALRSLMVTNSNSTSPSPSPSQLKSCGYGISWVPPQVYLSVLACISALLALALTFRTETHLDFIQRRLLLTQNVSGDLTSTGDGDIENRPFPSSCSLNYKDYFSIYRLALSINLLVFPVIIFNTSRRLLCWNPRFNSTLFSSLLFSSPAFSWVFLFSSPAYLLRFGFSIDV